MSFIRLNIGSGQRRLDTSKGWVNIDCISRDGQVPDLLCDVGKESLPYGEGTVETCCLHHVYEHFNLGAADGLIRECHRVLRPGGRLLVYVPDMKALAQRWLDGGIDDFIFMVNVYGAYQGEVGDIHKWGYTRDTLKQAMLNAAPWRGVMDTEWMPVPGADIARDWWILGVECVK